MPSATELAVQRRNTDAFINADALSVALNRAGLVSNGAGGFRRGAPSVLPPQTVRLVPVGAQYGGAEEHEMLDGQTVQVDYHMVAPFDADIERGDWFFLRDEKHEVVWVRSVGDYEMKAGVTNRG